MISFSILINKIEYNLEENGGGLEILGIEFIQNLNYSINLRWSRILKKILKNI